jgi:flagellar basal body rod protein FlgB
VDNQIFGILQFALDGVTAAQRQVADNLANAQTPGYTDHEVSFAASLEQALTHGGTAQVTDDPSPRPPASDGNNVSVTTELVEAQETTLDYQVLTSSFNAQFRLIQGASGGSFS